MALLSLDRAALRQPAPAAQAAGPQMASRHVLRRHGQRPLTINGELLCDLTAGGGEAGFCLSLRLYETRETWLAAAIEIAVGNHERSHAEAVLFDEPESVIDWLNGFDIAAALPCMVDFADHVAVERLQGDLARVSNALFETRAALARLLSTLFPSAAAAPATH
jgi:hypothetical protein